MAASSSSCELNAAGKTIVLATHDLDPLPVLADRCVVFDEEHRIVATGPPDDVLADRERLLAVNLIHPEEHASTWTGVTAGTS